MKIELKKIKDLTTGSLSVPPFQRNYSWKSNQIKDFFNDIKNSYETGEQEYFIGSMVFINEDNGVSIIDGQQRLATIFLFLFYYYKTINNEDKKNAFKYQNLFTNENSPKLKLNTDDNGTWEDILNDRNSENKNNLSKSAEKIKDIIDSTNDAEENINFILNNVVFAMVEATDMNNAYELFEVLNDRGLSLNSSDLIKNYFYECAKNKDDHTSTRVGELWMKIMYYFEDKNGDIHSKLFNDFLYSVFILRHTKGSKPQKGKLYREWEGIVNKDNVRKEIDQIHKLAQKYSFLYLESGDNDDELDSNTKDFKDLKNLGWLAQVPLIIKVNESNITNEEKNSILKYLYKKSISIGILQTSTGTFFGHISKLCYDMNNDDKNITKEYIKNFLDNKIDTNVDRVRAELENRRFNSRAKVLLKFIYKKVYNISSDDIDSLNIEHIISKKNNDKNWYVESLGNLLLIEPKINKTCDTKPFNKKKEEYGKSNSVVVNKFLEDYEDLREFNEVSIKGRTKDIAIKFSDWLINDD